MIMGTPIILILTTLRIRITRTMAIPAGIRAYHSLSAGAGARGTMEDIAGTTVVIMDITAFTMALLTAAPGARTVPVPGAPRARETSMAIREACTSALQAFTAAQPACASVPPRFMVRADSTPLQ